MVFCRVWLQCADISGQLVAVGMVISVAFSMTELVVSSSKSYCYFWSCLKTVYFSRVDLA